MMIKKIKGLIAAAFTPMDARGNLNLEVIKNYAAFLQKNGSKGVFVCGTTGEGASLSTAERIKVTESWMEHAPEGFKVIVHTGHNSLNESKNLAAHAQKIGAYATGAIAPSFFKPGSVALLIEHLKEIAEAAPNLPFYYYHMPAMTGVQFNMIDFLEKADQIIPNLAGIKFTNENLMDYGLCHNLNDKKFDLLFGRDEILLSGLVLGAQGAVGSTYNYMSPLYNQIIENFNVGNLTTAQNLQQQAMEFVRVLIQFGGGVTAGKAIMKLVGIDCGPTRLPLKIDLDIDLFRKELEKVGFFGFSSSMVNI